MMETYWRFRDQWDAQPEVMPEEGWRELSALIAEVRLKAQDVRLIAPVKICRDADALWLDAEELLRELVPNPEKDDYDYVSPPSYRWFKDRRSRGWGPDLADPDNFVNRARADLGAQSPLWFLRGDMVSYRKGISTWIRYEVPVRIPWVGKRVLARRHQRRQANLARRIPLVDPYTGEVVPTEGRDDT